MRSNPTGNGLGIGAKTFLVVGANHKDAPDLLRVILIDMDFRALVDSAIRGPGTARGRCLRMLRPVLGDGRAQLEAIADRVLEVIHPERQAVLARNLSPRWEGVSMSECRLSVLPLWVILVGVAGLTLGLWLVLGARLDAASQPVFREIHAVPLALRVVSETAGKPRLAPLLKDQVARGVLEVVDEPMRSVVRVPADALFVAGSARLAPGQGELLQRIAASLSAVPGQVAIIGHTDDQPVVSPQFPSSWHLTRERAQAVQAALVHRGVRSDRLRAEGRADAEPLVPHADEAQRARNRRIEIELRLPRPDE